ncbi:MAG: ATP citrate synthase, partial [Epsilonproteobacteria bacterium]|nr:ATP citrate synthase [Campylobacterota bacterium]
MGALFTKDTQAIFWNNNRNAIQRMLDYDYVIHREKPSVAAIVAPTSSNKFDKFFFGPEEVMIPIYRSTAEAVKNHPNADVLLNFASFRTAYNVTMDALDLNQFKTIMITAEGIPERLARIMNKTARDKGVLIIGPATVGAITPGAFKVA